jgi:membrane protein YdbS with pleckstrin-like domain
MSGGFCPSCGKPAAPEARFCAACGKQLPRLRGVEEPAPAARPAAASQAESTVFELRPLVVRTVLEALFSITIVGWIWLWLARLGRRYSVTTERIEVRDGVVTRTSRFIDLYRIEDFEVVEPWFLRMRGSGRLIIRSMDKDQPVAELEAIPDVRGVYEKLRELTRDERFRKGVRVLDAG